MILLVPMHTKATAEPMDEVKYKDIMDGLIDTARAYYARGLNIQYDSYRKSLYSSPEDATSRNQIYTVCSGFIFMTYYNALGIEIPASTDDLLMYGFNFLGTGNTLYYYNNNPTDKMKTYAARDGVERTIYPVYKQFGLSAPKKDLTEAEKNKFIDKIYDKVEPGDIYIYKRKSGHTMMVKEKKDGIIYLMEANGDNTSNDGNGARYNFNSQTDVVETKHGAVYGKIDMKDKLYGDAVEMAIIRIVNPKRQDFPTCKNFDVYGECERTSIPLNLTETAKTRLRLPDIKIEKVMSEDVHNQSYATLKSKLSYEIKITNNSSKAYPKFTVAEYIDLSIAEKINTTDSTAKINLDAGKPNITWTINSLGAGKTITLKYTAQVKNDENLYGKIYVSTGRVGNIATSKIETLIGRRLTSDQKKAVVDNYNDKINNKSYKPSSDTDFVNTIYKDALGLHLGLFFTDGSKKRDIRVKDLYQVAKEKPYMSSKYTPNVRTKYTIEKKSDGDEKDEFATLRKFTYGNYFGLRISEDHNEENNTVKASLAWKIKTNDLLTDRARVIKPETLENGDILIVTRKTATGEEKNGEPVYADKERIYIYINYGLRRYNDETKKYDSITGDKLTRYLNNIVGEHYIILRPYKKEEIESISPGTTIDANKKPTSSVVTKSEVVGDSGLTRVYYVGDEFDYKGEIIVQNYSGGSSYTRVPITNAKVSGFDTRTPGTKAIEIEVAGKTYKYTITVRSKTQNVLEDSSFVSPLRTTYAYNASATSIEEPDLTGGYLGIEDKDGKISYISLDNEKVTVKGFDRTKIGKQVITVEYMGTTKTFEIEIIDKKVKSIKVNSLPLKTKYLQNFDELDLTSGVIEVTFEDGTTDLISMTSDEVSVSGFNNEILGKQKLTVKYFNVESTFEVEIINKTIKSIEVIEKPFIIKYNLEDSLDLTNGALLVTYEDGTTELISLTNSNVEVLGFDDKKPGINTLTVKYAGSSTTLDIEVEGEDVKNDKPNTQSDSKNIIVIVCIVIAILTTTLALMFFIKMKKQNTNKVA